MKKYSLAFAFLLAIFCVRGNAQELNARVVVNSDRIEGTNRNAFNSLQQALNEFINGKKWSSAVFSTAERIDCTFSIVILSQSSENLYKAEITVTSQRPVYNSAYTTNLINFRDTNFEFEYIENSSIEYFDNAVNSNLVSVISFYANLILALDFDSFASGGGTYFFREAERIARQAQGQSGYSGWNAFDDSKNRYAIVSAYVDGRMDPYRELWYTYHRKGLDEMVAGPDRGRVNIVKVLPNLEKIRNNRSFSVVLQMFADSKLDEVVEICKKATSEEKKEIYDLLSRIYPTMSSQLEPLRK